MFMLQPGSRPGGLGPEPRWVVQLTHSHSHSQLPSIPVLVRSSSCWRLADETGEMVERLHKEWREKPAAGTAAVEVEVGVAMLACLLRDEKPILALLKKYRKWLQ